MKFRRISRGANIARMLGIFRNPGRFNLGEGGGGEFLSEDLRFLVLASEGNSIFFLSLFLGVLNSEFPSSRDSFSF